MLVTVSVHKRGLHPVEAAKAWHMQTRDGMSIDTTLAEGEVLNMETLTIMSKLLKHLY